MYPPPVFALVADTRFPARSAGKRFEWVRPEKRYPAARFSASAIAWAFLSIVVM